MSKIIYNIKDAIINPSYVGLISAPMDDGYIFEDVRLQPDIVKKVTEHFVDGKELEYSVLDCRTDTPLSTIDYSKFVGEGLSMTYLFFDVVCDYTTNVTFSIESIAAQRLWINGRLSTLCCTDQKTRRQLHTLRLDKGNNVFCIEQHQSFGFFRTTIRISTFEYENSLDEYSLISDNLHYEIGKIAVAVRDNMLFDGGILNFVCVPVDAVNIDTDSTIRFSIKHSSTGEPVLSKDISFYEYISINSEDILFVSSDLFDHAKLCFNYTDLTNQPHEVVSDVFLHHYVGYIEKTEEKARTLLGLSNLSNYAEQYITYQLKNANRVSEDDEFTFKAWYEFNIFLELIESEKYEEYMESPGFKKLYYYSNCDDQYIEYGICLPPDFSRTREYSLLIINTITDSSDSRYSHYFERTTLFPDLIVADIHGRGMTTGSYIGDLFFREILADILERFPINRRRIFSMGQSNGGYSTWVIAQKTPDLFAAINPSTGSMNPQELVNLSNVGIRFLTSDADPGHKMWMKIIDNRRNKLYDYDGIVFHKLMHNVFEQVQFSEPAIRKLIDKELNEYPREIYFKTYMNRYRRAYWLEIHSVSYGKIYGDVHGVIKDDDIFLTLRNVTGVTITLPPYLSEKNTRIIINNKDYGIAGKRVVSFERLSKGFKKASSVPAPKLYKGTGLLDVYLTPTRIINGLPKNEIFTNAAKNLSNPRTNTYEGVSSLTYPIIDSSDHILSNTEYYNGHSFIILEDVNSPISNNIIYEIRNSLQVTPLSNGYKYKDKVFDGNYCIMQIVENPFNKDFSVLYVTTNNHKFFKRQFFIRNMILPSYVSGFHPYLNSSALIFDEKGYHTILDYDMEIESFAE